MSTASFVLTDSAGHATTVSGSFTVVAAGADFGKALWITKDGTPSQTQVNTARTNVPAAKGYSSRQAWNTTAATPTVWKTTLNLGITAGCTRVAVRLISGSKMPAGLMGRQAFDASNVPFPMPYNTDGTPNSVFVANLKTEMRKAAVALLERADAIGDAFPILHWPWYSYQWSELYYGTEVRNVPGWSDVNFVNAHKAIIDAAKQLADEFPARFVTGFQLSGHGPIQNMMDDLANYIVSVFAPEQTIVHANGLSATGQWGQSDPAVDSAMDVAFSIAGVQQGGRDDALVGLQAIQPWGQGTNVQQTPAQWVAIYNQVRAAGGDSVEIYLETFLTDAGVTGALAAFQSETVQWLAEPR